jgi:hypothetical protein
MALKDEPTPVELSDSQGNVIFSGTDKEFSNLADKLSRPEEFPVPDKKQFAGKDYLEAPELKEVGDALIEHYENDFPHLLDANIVYLWKEKGGESGGLATLGKCIRPTGLAGYFAADEDEAAQVNYVIWAAADHLRENRASVRTVHALIFHELKHTAWQDGKLIVVGHEFEGFAREIEEFGMWTNSIKRIAEACETVKDVQQGLFTNVA